MPEEGRLRTAHVVFVDIVGYSLLATDEQNRAVHQLQSMVRELPGFADVPAADELIRIPTGDGMAIAYFGEPTAPVRFARDLAIRVRDEASFTLRIGLHNGPVYCSSDINANRNVAGGGINIAQRIMDCGDSGHILLSQSVADILLQLSHWRDAVQDLGECEVKHGLRLRIFNLSTPEFGNPNLPGRIQQANAAPDSIAVLPFSNPGGDPDTEYLSDGITESIINFLARTGRLRITPRSTVFRYKSRDTDPQVAGRELDVRVVLTGRVLQRGESLVVGSELVDIAAGTQVWGERYNRRLSDIFELEEEIARKISESLHLRLTSEEQGRLARRYTENTEAYQLYLRGRYHWLRRTPNHIKKGIEYFQHAIAKDPAYSLAYSGLADCYSILALYSVISPKDGFARAKAAAAAAVAMDPDLAEGHASLAFIRAYFDWEWAAADKEFERALEINPGYWVTPYWYSASLMSRGREDEAERQIRRAMELEPLSPVVLHLASAAAVFSRRYSEAVERCLRGIEYDPGYFLPRLWLGLAYWCQEKYVEAVTEFEKAHNLSGGVSFTAGALGNAWATVGNRNGALSFLQQLREESDREHTHCYQIALIYVGLGDAENALLWLEKACDARDAFVVFQVKLDLRFRSLHADERFQKILQRLRLA